jgi:hypothetical protein
MKRLITFVFAAALLFLPSPSQAQSVWEITSFHSDIEVQPDGNILVTETIETDFNQSKHGIFRDIPVKYWNSYRQNISLGLNILGVTDASGRPHKYEVSNEGAYRRIKIGDPDVYVNGNQTYVIQYESGRGLRFFEDHDELFWNVTGTAWEVPITNSTATVRLPFALTDAVEAICFTGPLGSTAQDCEVDINSGEIRFTANDFLTIAVSWPKGLIAEPSFVSNLGWFASDHWGLILPLLTAMGAYFVWSKRGRDPKGRGIVRQYEAPDDLSPSETGYLVKQTFRSDFVAAEIVSLAEKGYLTIKEVSAESSLMTRDKKDASSLARLGVSVLKKMGGPLGMVTGYELHRQSGTKRLKPHQQVLLEALFAKASNSTILLDDLPKDFYKEVEKVRTAVWKEIERAGYFAGKPETAWAISIALAFFLSVGLFFLAIVYDLRLDLVLGGILSSIILFVAAIFMPKRTPKGVAAYEYALGFELYITAAETDRVKWQETQNLFFDVLPYAMVFGIADKWASAFEGKLTQPPTWYDGATTFSTLHFSQSMTAFSAATASHSSPPSSSGSSSGFSGGSSGGGGGGGGGGSW